MSAHPPPHLRRALVFAAAGYAYVAAVLALLAGALALLVRAGLGQLGWYLVGGLIFFVARALLISISAAEGRRVTRDECPALFRAVDRARGELRAPEVNQILLTPEMNAGVLERPRFGLVGWTERTLVVGLPLLHGLPEDEVRAILAHEFAHLSREHGRSMRLLIRAEATWQSLVLGLEVSFRWASFLFLPFFRWYTPQLEARTQAASRTHEFESDRMAARAVGAATMARALVRLALLDRHLTEVLWPAALRGSREHDAPPPGAFTEVLAGLAGMPDAAMAGADAVLRQRTLDGHSHPSLAERLESLGFGAAAVRAEILPAVRAPHDAGAAGELLGARAGALAGEVDAAWAEAVEPLWRGCRSDARIWRAEEGSEAPSADAAWARARWSARCEPHAAVPLLRDVVAREPHRAEARVLLGSLLLQREGGTGADEAVRILEAESRQESVLALAAAEALESFYADQGWERDVRRCRARLAQLRYAALRAAGERLTVGALDTLRPYALPSEAHTALLEALAARPEVRRAFLVEKRSRYLADTRLVVLAVDLKAPWYRFTGGSWAAGVLAELLPHVQLPELGDALVTPADGHIGLLRRLRGVPGAEIFSRGAPAPRPVASGEWSKVSPLRAALAPRFVVPAVLLLAAITALGSGDPEPATPEERAARIDELRREVREEPGDADAHRELAFALMDADRWAEAEPVLEEAIRRNPRDAHLRNSLGWALNQKGEFGRSIPLLREAVRLDSAHPNAHHNLAWALLRTDSLHASEAAYRQAVRWSESTAGARSELGFVLMRLGRLEEAERELQVAARLDPSSAWTHRTLGRVHKARGDLPEAVAAFRTAARLAGNDAELWAEIGHVEHLRGRFRESATAFDNAHFVDPTYFQRDPYRREIREASSAGRMYVPRER